MDNRSQSSQDSGSITSENTSMEQESNDPSISPTARGGIQKVVQPAPGEHEKAIIPVKPMPSGVYKVPSMQDASTDEQDSGGGWRGAIVGTAIGVVVSVVIVSLVSPHPSLGSSCQTFGCDGGNSLFYFFAVTILPGILVIGGGILGYRWSRSR